MKEDLERKEEYILAELPAINGLALYILDAEHRTFFAEAFTKEFGEKVCESLNREYDSVINLDGKGRSYLEKSVCGAIRDAINAHGPLTIETAPSAAKRVIGVIKRHNNLIRKRREGKG